MLQYSIRLCTVDVNNCVKEFKGVPAGYSETYDDIKLDLSYDFSLESVVYLSTLIHCDDFYF